MMKSIWRFVILAMVALIALIGNLQVMAQTPTRTPAPTRTPRPTRTPVPTATPIIETATLVEVVDGDEIKVQITSQAKPVSVRYLGLDAPERAQGTVCFNKEAREFNQSLLKGTLRLERDRTNRDLYGRLLRYVILSDGRMVNEEMLKGGYARLRAFPPNLRYQKRFQQIEREARQKAVGLWGACLKLKPVTPTPTPMP
jgi:micrococcal nuclease